MTTNKFAISALHPRRLSADIDAALDHQAIDIAPAERNAHAHQEHEADHRRPRGEGAKPAIWLSRAGHVRALPWLEFLRVHLA